MMPFSYSMLSITDFSKTHLTLQLILNITPHILTWTQLLIFLFYTDRFSSKCTPICHNIKSPQSWSELHWSSCYVLPGCGIQMENAWPAPSTQMLSQSKSTRHGNSHPDDPRNSQVVDLSSKFPRSRSDQAFVDHAGTTLIHVEAHLVTHRTQRLHHRQPSARLHRTPEEVPSGS